MATEADLAFRQAFALCPYSPEVVFRYVGLLLQNGRKQDALLVATTASKIEPANGQFAGMVGFLKAMK
jgi:Flp pilus assembly protein TadD